MPRHVNPISSDSVANAPYNFVPLPEKVLFVDDGYEININEEISRIKPWEKLDRFIPGTNSGWIDLEITTLTPLYIRGRATHRDGAWDMRDSRLRPEPTTTMDGRPMIPGSGLRGVIRNLFEILTFSKINPVSKERPFFRSVGKDRMAQEYRKRIVQADTKPTPGFIRNIQGNWTIEPADAVWRVPHGLLSKAGFKYQQKPNYSPQWEFQHQDIWFKPGSNRSVEKVSLIEPDDATEWIQGTLVLTGSAQNKKQEFLFVPAENSNKITIPYSIWQRFHDDDQITRWQEKAFPKDKPKNGGRPRKGHLRDGEPVFFLCSEDAKSESNPNGLLFFGRAQMFRFPYDLGPLDITPSEHSDTRLDMAQAVFGTVFQERRNGNEKSVKGRVFFEDAIALGENSAAMFEELLVPSILSSPKVTTFQHYLTQDGTKGKDQLTTYFNEDQTTIRGHKLYWHRWDAQQGLNLVREADHHDNKLSMLRQGQDSQYTQHTLVQPVKDSVTFVGRVRFKNLTDVELGALILSLDLPDNCAHKLGMGKPLGLGSVKIKTSLKLINPKTRYGSWESSGVESVFSNSYRKSFVSKIFDHAKSANETLNPGKEELRKIARLDALFLLLEWEGRPNINSTTYMNRKQFQDKPILPSPHQVAQQAEPLWRSDPPLAGPVSTSVTNIRTGSSVSNQEVVKIKPIEKGQIREGFLHRSENQWVTRFQGDDRDGIIVNSKEIPQEVEGRRAEFYITEQSKRVGIKARFLRILK